MAESLKFSLNIPLESVKISDQIRSSLRSNKMFGGPTHTLVVSI